MKNLTFDTFDEAVKNGAVVVDCYADWCGPCKMLSPIIDQLADEYAGRVDFAKVDVDEESEIAARFGIMSIPCVLFFKDGELVNQSIGFKAKAALENDIAALL